MNFSEFNIKIKNRHIDIGWIPKKNDPPYSSISEGDPAPPFDMLTLDVQDLETGTSALEDEGLEMEATTLECYPDLVGSLNRKLTCKWE